jgi:hypothetical protein
MIEPSAPPMEQPQYYDKPAVPPSYDSSSSSSGGNAQAGGWIAADFEVESSQQQQQQPDDSTTLLAPEEPPPPFNGIAALTPPPLFPFAPSCGGISQRQRRSICAADRLAATAVVARLAAHQHGLEDRHDRVCADDHRADQGRHRHDRDGASHARKLQIRRAAAVLALAC